jgi:hypothetical protein
MATQEPMNHSNIPVFHAVSREGVCVFHALSKAGAGVGVFQAESRDRAGKVPPWGGGTLEWSSGRSAIGAGTDRSGTCSDSVVEVWLGRTAMSNGKISHNIRYLSVQRLHGTALHTYTRDYDDQPTGI